MRGIALRYRRRRCTQRLYNAPATASRMDAGSVAGMTAQKGHAFPSSPAPPRVPHQVRDDGVLRRLVLLHCRPHTHHVIPASEPESWAAFCVVLRCAIASLVFILACASLLDSGSSPE